MGLMLTTGSKSLCWRLMLILIFLFSTVISIGKVIASEDTYIGVRNPSPERYGLRLFAKQKNKGLSLADFTDPSILKPPKTVKREVKIDSLGRRVSIKEKTFDVPMNIPAQYSLSDYTNYCLNQNVGII